MEFLIFTRILYFCLSILIWILTLLYFFSQLNLSFYNSNTSCTQNHCLSWVVLMSLILYCKQINPPNQPKAAIENSENNKKGKSTEMFVRWESWRLAFLLKFWSENISWLNCGYSNYSQESSLSGGFNEVYMSAEFLIGFRNTGFLWCRKAICSSKTPALGPREQMQTEFSVILRQIYPTKVSQFGL